MFSILYIDSIWPSPVFIRASWLVGRLNHHAAAAATLVPEDREISLVLLLTLPTLSERSGLDAYWRDGLIGGTCLLSG